MPEPTPEAWAQIRHDYEHTDRPIVDICAEHGITDPMLRYRVKRWKWQKRRSLIPRQGPPPVPAMAHESAAPPPAPDAAPVHPTPAVFATAQTASLAADDPPAGEEENAPDLIVLRLQGAVARVLPAIEATIARLAGGSHHPRDMDQAGRALSALTRTLRELNTLLAQHKTRLDAADPYGGGTPEDIDALREALAQRIEAFMASQPDEDDEVPDSARDA